MIHRMLSCTWSHLILLYPWDVGEGEIHSFVRHQYFLRAYSMLGTELHTRDSGVSKVNMVPAGLDILIYPSRFFLHPPPPPCAPKAERYELHHLSFLPYHIQLGLAIETETFIPLVSSLLLFRLTGFAFLFPRPQLLFLLEHPQISLVSRNHSLFLPLQALEK